MHTLAYVEEIEEDAVFICGTCGDRIGFNKPGIGVPSAIPSAGSWEPPANPDQWMSPCPS